MDTMPMELPTDANINLLVCDGVRQSPDGKLDVAGYFPTAEVKLDPAAQLPVVLNLTFVFVLKDGDGQFRPTLRIADPLGKELHKFDVPEIKKLAGVAHVLILPVAQIPIRPFGELLYFSGNQRTAISPVGADFSVSRASAQNSATDNSSARAVPATPARRAPRNYRSPSSAPWLALLRNPRRPAIFLSG